MSEVNELSKDTLAAESISKRVASTPVYHFKCNFGLLSRWRPKIISRCFNKKPEAILNQLIYFVQLSRFQLKQEELQLIFWFSTAAGILAKDFHLWTRWQPEQQMPESSPLPLFLTTLYLLRQNRCSYFYLSQIQIIGASPLLPLIRILGFMLRTTFCRNLRIWFSEQRIVGANIYSCDSGCPSLLSPAPKATCVPK